MDKFFGLPERLKAERERLGLSQTDFGRFGDVSKNSQLAYEQGKAAPDVGYLARIAEKGVDVAYLFTGVRTIARPGLAQEEIQLFNDIVDAAFSLSDEGRLKAKSILGELVRQEFEATGKTRTSRKLGTAVATRPATPAPVTEMNLELLQVCLAGVEEGLEATGRGMAPDKKAQLVTMLYDLHQATDSPPQKATILQFLKRAA